MCARLPHCGVGIVDPPRRSGRPPLPGVVGEGGGEGGLALGCPRRLHGGGC